MILAALVAFASLASAQQINQGLQPSVFRDFSGGYVDNVDPVNLKPNESPNLQNVYVDLPVGSIVPRKGFVLCGTTPSGNVATNIAEYARSDGTRRLIVTDNSNVWSTPDCQTWTTIATTANGLSASNQVYFATVRDKLWIVNGSTWPATWDGTTYQLLDGAAPNTPNPPPPRCSFIEFWKERVWCGSPYGDPSGVAYSALTDTNGNGVDPSTGALSWPAVNDFEINQNAGSRVYGVKAYRNRLYAFKDNGIWEIGFNNDFDNFVRKTYATVGSRYQTSIVENDGLLYFTGRDGIYAFDGDNAQRISRRIEKKFYSLNQPLISQNYRLWSKNADWNAGTFNQATDNDSANTVTLSSSAPLFSNGSFENGLLSPFVGLSTGLLSNYASQGVASISGQSGNFAAYVKVNDAGMVGSGKCQYVPLASNTLTIFDNTGSTLTTVSPNPSYSGVSTYTLDTSAWVGKTAFLHFQSYVYCGDNNPRQAAESDLYSPSFIVGKTLSFEQEGCSDLAHCETYAPSMLAGWDLLDNIQGFQYLSTGSWTSEIYNTVSVSTWGAFLAGSVSNGGAISYQIHYGTNTGAVQEMPYQAITPGSLIPANTSQTYIQVQANLTPSSDLTQTPQLQSVQIAWNNGGNNTQKIYAASWKNALWVAASSGTDTNNNIVFHHSRAPLDAWTLHDEHFGPMATFNDQFYAAASTWSAVYRADFGTNDNGAPITWYWESKDENYGLPNNAKYLTEVDADYRNDVACNVRLGYRQDLSTTACVGNIAALGQGIGSRRLLMNGGPAYTYRFYICDDQLDQKATITGVTGWARSINKRGD